MKKPIYKRVWFWLIIVFAIIIVGGTSSESDSTDTPNNSPISEPSTNTSNNSSGNDGSTFGERMALGSAKNYLKTMGFSKTGLIKQLEFEGYSTSEATYAVNHCGANWKDEAVRVAKNYLKNMSFSRQGLKDQLIFEGFTDLEAEYGVNQAYK